MSPAEKSESQPWKPEDAKPNTKYERMLDFALTLECSGYGQRPDWLDSGPREKEMAAKIRETVKEVTSQKKRLAMQQRQIQTQPPEEEKALISPPPVEAQLLHPSTSVILDSSPHENDRRVEDLPRLVDGPPPGLLPANAASYVASHESVLLMHYLDKVFPQQFLFYESSLEEGGRGWLLTLLMNCKPLFHAACSLAAYHRQITYCLREGMAKPCFSKEALQLHYGNFGGRYATSMLYNTVYFPGACRAALSFFAAVGLWFEIISCTTTGSAPFECDNAIEEAAIQFERAIGCENWVVMAIKDVARLNHWKTNRKATGQLSMRELVSRGIEIENRLNSGLEKNLQKIQQFITPGIDRNHYSLRKNHSYISSCVTRVYCCAGLVQLHVVISRAHPELPEIHDGVTRAMEAFKALPDPEIINSLVWPLCIVGCMASEQDEGSFLKLARCANPSDSTLGAAKARTIMEECWRLRRLDPGSGNVTWKTAMDSLEFNILLI
ncbi:hypothetical protein G7Y89_g10480 [Cudoniella acicularis]|uniref:Uncharacterized protein n=1 Tax=Cudoniella acicularis TaxID=354080 RepID=A0A8H4VZ60_9HELO|nr:hypothetical protein G7Y89_g10480 [Cudoniella acicularis]